VERSYSATSRSKIDSFAQSVGVTACHAMAGKFTERREA